MGIRKDQVEKLIDNIHNNIIRDVAKWPFGEEIEPDHGVLRWVLGRSDIGDWIIDVKILPPVPAEAEP